LTRELPAGSFVIVEDIAQFGREDCGLAGGSGLPSEEGAVVAREPSGLPTEQLRKNRARPADNRGMLEAK
jgi:hypothetical protein